MASDGPGKYRERKSRTTKPYDRPKGIIRRVTDSVTGLFSTSWLSGWIGSEEDEESSDQQAGPSQTSTLAPAGESFIFAQPVTARRPFRPIYPEEGETETNSQQPVNEGASTSSGVRMSVPAAPSLDISATNNRSVQLIGDTPRPSMTGRRLPIISSTPSPMFTTRTKSQLESRSLPLLTSSTPTGDDGSEVSESSVDTGVDASVIPRPDERDYQREILQLDEESLQTLRDSLTKSGPTVPAPQPASALPSLEETRKRPRDLEPDNTSVRAEGSVSSKSLFSEAGDIAHGQPQPSGMGSKRPRFNVSLYGTPVLSDRSVLSDSAFKSSPFYPGKTMYGGASACRSRRLQTRTLHQTARTQVRAKAAPESTDDGGLSQAARRILESLEQMSTPISDAKRIPTPTPGQRGSFLDATPSYTAAFHRHRPALRPSAPPISRLLTPTKLTVQENLATSLLASTSASTSCPSGSPAHQKNTKVEVTHPTTEVPVSEQEETKKSVEVSTESCTASLFSKAAAEATAKLKPSKAEVSSTTAAALPQEELKFVLPTNSSASQNTLEFTPKPATTVSSLTSDSSQPSKKVGGKMKSKIVDSGRSSTRHDEEEVVEEPQLPSVPLTMFSLPKIDLSIPSPVTSSPTNLTSSSKGFKFSIPKIVDTQSTSETLPSAPKFTFRNPVLINEGNLFADSSCATVAPTTLMFNSSSPALAPKLKTNNKKVVVPTAEKLKEGSILDILKPKGNISDKLCTTSSLSNSLGEKLETDTPNSKKLVTCPMSVSEQSVNSVAKETETSHGFREIDSAFKKSSDEWECSVCMVRNKNSAVKCIACETQKPEQSLNSSTKETTTCVVNVEGKPPPLSGSVSGWGDTFKKSTDEWDCDMCLLRNKGSLEKCVACETPKPGNKIVSTGTEVSKVIDDTEEKTKLGFGSAFAKGKGEWECDTCLVRNKSDATKCISCETPRPGAANVSQAITGNFKFGVNTNDLSSTNSTFKFGLSNSQSEFKSSGLFDFGVCAKSTEDSNSQGNSGFKFGVPAEKPNALTGLSFGLSSESVQSKEKKQCASVGFSFGVQSSDSKEKEVIEPPSELLPVEAEVADVSKPEITNEPPSELISTVSKSNENSSESVTAPNPIFQFDSGSKTDVAFSFESGTQVKSTAKEDQGKDLTNENNSAIELQAENDVDALEKEKDPKPSDNFSSGSKADDNLDGVEKPSFTFNSVLSTPCKNDDKNANPLSFGASKATDSASESSSSTLIFGASTVENSTPAAGTFTFSDKESKTTAALSFSFNPPTVSKEETKSASIFNFSTKRDSSDTGEPAKKMTFSSPSTGGINNGVSASPSLFTFGSKENKMSAGSGFREIPSSTPAFGARAPASNATPSFQFGNSNPPAPAATAPAPAFGNPAPAFGSATPAFGSSNSSSTQNFVFGQPPEKTSAGFDFGQAANSAGTQGFNFAAAQSNSRIFLFGQSPANSTSSQVGIFKFGTTNTEVPTPAPSMGSDNPFNSPAPPSRRVVKKAFRRNPRK